MALDGATSVEHGAPFGYAHYVDDSSFIEFILQGLSLVLALVQKSQPSHNGSSLIAVSRRQALLFF